MTLSVLDLFSIGIGPSSSHTVGPMRAANRFLARLLADGRLEDVDRVEVELFGSLAATGRGHGTDKAVVLGLEGGDPETIEPAGVAERFREVAAHGGLRLGGTHPVAFDVDADIVLHHGAVLPSHPNGLRFTAYDPDGSRIRADTLYSIGGGFVVDDAAPTAPEPASGLPYPFETAQELLAICHDTGFGISDVMRANEVALHGETKLGDGIAQRWRVMRECVSNGCETSETVLPGALRVPRRAPALRTSLIESAAGGRLDPGEWVNLYALAVNEENAAGGRVVTAPTNGAAGIVPAVLHYYSEFVPGATSDGVLRFFLTAAAVGLIIKTNASISGAEVGCQGEVGSACAMAAAGLCEVLGGTPEQVENAAEIGIEHHLGLTCDPVGGLVQVPCIERNAIASNTAITAARLALRGSGAHLVSLDTAVRTMRETGADMSHKYKETSQGGLALNVVEC